MNNFILTFRQGREYWKKSSASHRKNMLLLASVFFLILFSYPMIRSTTTSIFLQKFGAKNSPLVWFYSILGLSLVVTFFNKFQATLRIQNLYQMASLVTVVFFVGAYYFKFYDLGFFPYLLYVWKEIYIVILIHITFGYVNAILAYKEAKLFFGPLGAIGSLGGVLGGALTTGLTYIADTPIIMLLGALAVFISGILFHMTDSEGNLSQKNEEFQHEKRTPVGSIAGVERYVFLIIAAVALSQFVINLANFKFNLLFETMVADKNDKTRYLGILYGSINAVSLLVQLFVITPALSAFNLRSMHFFIPLFYSGLALFCFYLGAGFLFPVSLAFVFYKGFDYSMFSSIKELLYFPLSRFQKYGAKYLTDMIAYRAAKGVISILLLYWQSRIFVDSALWMSLILWILVVHMLFKEREKFKIKPEVSHVNN